MTKNLATFHSSPQVKWLFEEEKLQEDFKITMLITINFMFDELFSKYIHTALKKTVKHNDKSNIFSR